jgi:hypothetical protein
MPVTYFDSYDAQSPLAEDIVLTMSYPGLLDNLGRLTELGIIGPHDPVTMLVGARIVDRSRIAKSGIHAADIRSALQKYLQTANAVPGIVKALEVAVEMASIAGTETSHLAQAKRTI